ncbi:MAG: phenylacetate-CoA oxygenase/reductase subunit PaaK [Lewinellaceae bacterium]|nr:phenylacetate-CoA oxygenase/reductase subunit PaaK [Lewinellaceae bacterium]
MPKFHKLAVKEIRRETAECITLAFEVPEGLEEEYRFIQGQHLTIKAEVGGNEVRRSYSICAGPGEGSLRVAVKKVSGGSFSTFANEQLQVGDTLDVMTPMGRFYTDLSPANEKQYVAFAAGSGITPILSIMKAVLGEEARSTFTLFYGNRRVDSIIFREEIEGLKNTYMGRLGVHHILSGEKLGSPLFTGRIDAEKCRVICDKLIDPLEVDEFFLCGPQEMAESIRQVLLEKGVDARRIHFELFTTSRILAKQQEEKPPVKGPEVESRIAIKLDDNTFEFPLSSNGDTILEAALRAGASLPFACKGGVCCTCRAKLLEGEVSMDVNYALEPDEVAEGYILACQSHPKTDKVSLDFDV